MGLYSQPNSNEIVLHSLPVLPFPSHLFLQGPDQQELAKGHHVYIHAVRSCTSPNHICTSFRSACHMDAGGFYSVQFSKGSRISDHASRCVGSSFQMKEEDLRPRPKNTQRR